MDLKSYFKPLSDEIYQNQNNWQTTQIGHQIQSNNSITFPEYKYCEIALFNIREYQGSDNLFTRVGILIKRSRKKIIKGRIFKTL